MRIIGGRAKGSTLKMPKGIRPTSDKVREALFDILSAEVNNAKVLDLFAGSGSVGIEALSRGAKSAVFVEDEKRCVVAIKKNLEKIGASYLTEFILAQGGSIGTGKSHFTKKNREPSTANGALPPFTVLDIDVFKAVELLNRKRQKFDLIFLDPPYYRNLAKKTLINVVTYDIVEPNGLVVAEHYKKDVLPEAIDDTSLMRRKWYGDTVLSFYKRPE